MDDRAARHLQSFAARSPKSTAGTGRTAGRAGLGLAVGAVPV